MTGAAENSLGKVFLVGAGPGDPGMLTIRGMECLQQADVVLHDYLANPRLLKWAGQAETICLGKHGGGRLYSQEEINQQIVQFAKSGKKVVRLKGGDPAIFARTHEELEEICRHGIPYEVVPGITSALALTGTVGIPLTHRNYASAVALVTGQGKSGGPSKHIDYQALAQFPGTIVFYMGTTTVETWSNELIKAGMDPRTPVVATRNCSLPSQTSFRCQLDEIASHVNQETKLRPPVLFVVGQAADDFGKFNWFENRPLFGQTILVTRPAHQSDGLIQQLEELGAEVLAQPAIEIGPIDNLDSIQQCAAKIREYDWIVFSSANGVEYFMKELLKTNDIRCLGNAKVAAIGPATAARIEEFHISPDLVPEKFQAENLADELSEQVSGKNVLLIRASRGREILFDQLSKVASNVEQLVCYQSRDVTTASQQITERMQAGEIGLTTVTSSAIATSLVNLFGESLRQTRLISISPITSDTLRSLGFEPAAEADPYTMPGILGAIAELAKENKV